MGYSLYLKPTWKRTAPELSLVSNSKVALVLNLVHVVQSKAPYCDILQTPSLVLSVWCNFVTLAFNTVGTLHGQNETSKTSEPTLFVNEDAGGDDTDQVFCQNSERPTHALSDIVLLPSLVREAGIDQWSPLM